jgi:type IV pilus assembly protein PilE
MAALGAVPVVFAFAMPSYREYLRRGAVEDVTTTLGTGRIVAVQYFLDNHTYVGAPCPRATDVFALSCNVDAFEYKMTATGLGALDGFVYTLDQSGARTTAGPWGSGECWIAREGDGC